MGMLSIGSIVQVNVNVIPGAPVIEVGCNKGLIVGSSEVITTEDRVKEYKSLKDVLDGGFELTDPEYLAAKMYFSQTPAPRLVYIGRVDKTEDSTETLVQAVGACMEKAPGAYGVYLCGASDADIDLVAGLLEAEANGLLFFETSNPDSLVKSPAAPDIFTSLKGKDVKRAFGLYSNTQYAGAALMGSAMGLETGVENSAFTMAYKSLVGVQTEKVTSEQLNNLLEKNGNVFVLRGQAYKLLQMGRCVNGISYDDVMYLDMTQNIIEAKVMEVLTGNKAKRPQTDAGMAVILAAVTNALEYMRDIGYLAEGVWNGDPIKSLMPGDVVPGGFMVFVDSFATLSQADREARKAPPVWVALKTAGTIESVVINVNVNL